MAWPIPNVGQWNPGMTMTPDFPGINMGSLTPEQWTMMQQQNWQQWTQWQQQYAQWQSQYGDKYAEQMQAMQTMGMPPQPVMSNAPPPVAPPLPNKPPPPPPPHENDQPLYDNAKSKSSTATLPQTYNNFQMNENNITVNADNNQTWAYNAGSWNNEVPTAQSLSSGNSEALKKLAEEERLFDIQFQKWEEEIQKWKLENVNHPDKRAYSEYEQKFEACRAQLLERRQQMKIKRVKLLGNTSHSANITNTGNNNVSPSLPPQTRNYTQDNTTNQPNHQISKPAQNYHHQTQYQHNSMQDQDYKRNHNNDPQDRYDNRNEPYVPKDSDGVGFLPTIGSTKQIPGLDLVPDTDKGNVRQEVIDVTEDEKPNPVSVPPDYSTISQGINSILGDEKIMNILTMMKNQNTPHNVQNTQFVDNNIKMPPMGLSNAMTPGQWNRNDRFNRSNESNQVLRNDMNIDDRQSSTSYNNRPPTSYENRSTLSNSFGNRQVPPTNFDHKSQFNQNNSYGGREPVTNNLDIRQSSEFNMPNMDNYGSNQGRIIRPPNFSEPQQSSLTQPGPSMNRGPHGQHIGPMPPIQDNLNTNYQRGFERGPLQENVNPPVMTLPKPKWVEEPLFTPSIIVEYEHKPLRLRARDFIEPVHTFDYNHKSKDEDVRKKDFEEEVEHLFTRKPRTYEKENDHTRHRDSYPREYERRVPENQHDDFRQRQMRDDYYYKEKPKTEDRYNDRRDDCDVRFERREDHYRQRQADTARDIHEREKSYSRDKDFGRVRDSGRDQDLSRGREFVREKDFVKERNVPQFGRDRGVSRERDSFRERDTGRDKDFVREREGWRDRRDQGTNRNRDRDRDRRDPVHSHDTNDSRKRPPSLDSEVSDSSSSKKTKELNDHQPKHVVMIDDILESPGRETRPEKILIIMRGIPGSGKSYLAKLIRDREAELGGTVRIMSIDDYFMQEGEVEQIDSATGKTIKKPTLKYEYDEKMEETYITSLKKALKRCITDGYFSFIVFDAVNDQLKSYADMWNFARQNGFQVYICTLESDLQTCFKRNIHNRKLEEIEMISSKFFPTPQHHINLDPTTLLQNAAITEVQMEDADISMEDAQENEPSYLIPSAVPQQVENSFTSKWERMDDVNQLARLDGTNKPLRASKLSMEDYLQLDEWTPSSAKPGKKTVRWADIEERRQQEKMRAIGFVVGQTDWNRMTDPTLGSSALTQTKYIERIRRN